MRLVALLGNALHSARQLTCVVVYLAVACDSDMYVWYIQCKHTPVCLCTREVAIEWNMYMRLIGWIAICTDYTSLVVHDKGHILCMSTILRGSYSVCQGSFCMQQQGMAAQSGQFDCGVQVQHCVGVWQSPPRSSTSI